MEKEINIYDYFNITNFVLVKSPGEPIPSGLYHCLTVYA